MQEPRIAEQRARTVAVVLTILFLVGLAALSIWNTARLRDQQALVAHTHLVLQQTTEALARVVEAESAVRAFFITGRDEYLAPYDAATAALPAELDALDVLTTDNPRQQLNIARFRQLIDARLAVLRVGIATRRATPLPLLPPPTTTEGARLAQEIRHLVQQMKDEESELLRARQRAAGRAFTTATTTEAGAAVFGIALVIGLFMVERRRVRESDEATALIASERERLRVTLSSIGDAVIATDASGKVTLINPVAEQLTGWHAAEARDRGLTEIFNIVSEDTRAPVENPAIRALSEGAIVGLANHTILVSRDGVERFIDDSAAPIRDGNGQTVGSVLVFRDITERRHSEEASRVAHARRMAMLDSALDCIVTIDHQGNILEFNPACEKAFGHTREQAFGQTMRDLVIAPATREAFDSAIRDAIAGKVPGGRRLELTALRLDGTEFPVELSITSMPNHGSPLIAAYLRDITDRRDGELRQQTALHVEQARSAQLRQVAAASVTLNSALSESSLAGIIEGEARRILDADVHLRMTDQVPAATKATLVAPLRDPGGSPIGFLVAEAKDDRAFTEDDASLLEQLANMTAIAVENARLYERLRENDRYKDEFLAILAHELRNPLAPIRTGLSLLAISNGDTKVFEQAQAMIERQVAQMVRLIDDLMDVARVSRGKIELRKQRITLSAVLNSALESSRSLIEAAGHQLSVTFPPDPIPLEADLTRLAQVFFNLLSNAAKYTERGGQIFLSAEGDGDMVKVRVRDTGVGIPPEMLSRVFEMFIQVDPTLEHSRGGLGIGLTIVKKLVDLHGGAVEVHSEGTGRGTEFVVKLPIAHEDDVAGVADAHRASVPRQSPQRRVVVVDDNQDAADSLVLMLRLLGHDVRVAYDGQEAIDVAADFKPEFVLLDIGLPRLNGYEAARRIRELPGGGNITLIAVTGWGQDEDRRRSREAGFDQHMVKPVDPTAISDFIAGNSSGGDQA